MDGNFIPGMTITIDLRLCEQYGYAESFIIARIKEEVFRNYTRDLYYYDGYYWTRFSIKTLYASVPHCSYATIQRKIAKLKELGVIKCEKGTVFDEDFSGNEVLYTLTDNSFLTNDLKTTYQIDNSFETTYQIDNTLRERKEKEKNQKKKNNKENNNILLSSNALLNNKKKTRKENCDSDESSCDKSQRCAIEEIICYLNEVTGKKFRTNSQLTKRHLNARLNEDYTVDDFKKVIAYKYEQWCNDKKMREYLRPETLFGTKFEGYLNSVPDDFAPKTKEPEKTAEELEIEKLLEGYQ